MTTHETDQPHEVDHADENDGVDSEGDELAQEQAAEAEEAEPVGVDDDLDDLDHTDPRGADDDLDTERPADPDADVADEAAAFGSPGTEDWADPGTDADTEDRSAIALGPIDAEDEDEDVDGDLADELEETEVKVPEPEPVDNEDTTNVDADDESVLLTESAPGSVLPPEEPEDPEGPEALDVPEAGTDPVLEEPVAEAPLPVPEPSPEALLEPVGAETPIDPGTGTHQERWSAIQGSFVDDPLRTVESAGSLVEEMLHELERAIAEQRAALDAGWDTGSSTDDLRAAFRSYRDMFKRLAALLAESQPSG